MRITIGTTRIEDDTGLEWIVVVVANENADVPWSVEPANEDGQRMANATAAALASRFTILGFEAGLGEVQLP